MPLTREDCVKSWARKLTTADVADVETTKSGRRRVKFNHSKAAEAILLKLPIAYVFSPYRSGWFGFWDGQSYTGGLENILLVVLDTVAGNAASRRHTNETLALMRAKLLTGSKFELADGGGRYPDGTIFYRRLGVV